MHPSQHTARARRALPAHESDPLRTTWLGARATIPHATPCGRVQPPAVHGGRRALGVVLHLGLRRRTIGCFVVAPCFLQLAISPPRPPRVAFIDASTRIPPRPRGRSRSCHLRWCIGGCGSCLCLCGCLRTASWCLAPIGFSVLSWPITLLGPTFPASAPSDCRHESPSPGGCCRSRRI